MQSAALVFPHQLFAEHPALRRDPALVVLVEDSLFFGDEAYPARFHVHKLAFHRATMAAWAARAREAGHAVEIVRYEGPRSALGPLVARLAEAGHERIVVADVHDFMLARRLKAAAAAAGLTLATVETPAFLNDPLDNVEYRAGKKRWYMADFYRWQRTRLGILIDADGEPEGGRWSFDEDNRKKLPRREKAALPALPDVRRDESIDESIDGFIDEAVRSVTEQFPDNPGSVERWRYPIDHAGAAAWLQVFVDERLVKFGPYEDAIASGESWLYHGVLTPMLNAGLLTPRQVLDAVLEAARERDVPINSLEGFVRQLVGWREFMRATYDDLGVPMRTTNRWKHARRMPKAFYDATTGIDPVDDVIRRTLDHAYAHHIERLMVLGGFMFLCEIDPDDIYTWFMEMYVDAYDWVMVPNAYAMSQHADGGSITTKPYFSGSNYVLKMSDHARGEWCVTWDGLFWRWIADHADELGGNPRWSMMVANVRRMDAGKLAAHREVAEAFLARLDAG